MELHSKRNMCMKWLAKYVLINNQIVLNILKGEKKKVNFPWRFVKCSSNRCTIFTRLTMYLIYLYSPFLLGTLQKESLERLLDIFSYVLLYCSGTCEHNFLAKRIYAIVITKTKLFCCSDGKHKISAMMGLIFNLIPQGMCEDRSYPHLTSYISLQDRKCRLYIWST